MTVLKFSFSVCTRNSRAQYAEQCLWLIPVSAILKASMTRLSWKITRIDLAFQGKCTRSIDLRVLIHVTIAITVGVKRMFRSRILLDSAVRQMTHGWLHKLVYGAMALVMMWSSVVNYLQEWLAHRSWCTSCLSALCTLENSSLRLARLVIWRCGCSIE